MGLGSLGRRGVAFAVLGAPDGDDLIEAPADRAAMARLHEIARAQDKQFFCSSLLGGCGARLVVVNGTQRRPHFRHHGEVAACHLPEEARVRDILTHRAIQRVLVSWLTELGYRASPEHRLDARSRVDVHCAPGHVIEVQLSPESETSMISRTERYGGSVTWLFDPTRPITSRDAALGLHGSVLVVRLRRGDSPPLAPRDRENLNTTDDSVEIGVRCDGFEDQDQQTVWAPLSSCSFTPRTGIRPSALAMAEQWLKDRQSKQAAEPRHHEEHPPRTPRRQDGPLPRPGPVPAPIPAPEPRFPADLVAAEPVVISGPRPTVWNHEDLLEWEVRFTRRANPNGAWVRVLRLHNECYRDWVNTVDGRWLNHLPAHLVDVAWSALYLTTLISSAQVCRYIDVSLDPDDLVLHRMADLGLVLTYSTRTGQPMLRANHRLRRSNPGKLPSQPPPWEQA